ncbi:MAG: FG-GAP repeat domain-containing protein [Acidimicrobiales bacterium]
MRKLAAAAAAAAAVVTLVSTDVAGAASAVDNVTYNIGGRYQLVGDFDGDNFPDVFIYTPDGGGDFVLYGSLPGQSAPSPTPVPRTVTSGYTPMVGDFDGDTNDDIFWYAQLGGNSYIWWGIDNNRNMGSSDSVSRVVAGGYDSRVGDFNGDGKDDILWYAQLGGNSYMWTATGARDEAGAFTDSAPFNPVGGYVPQVGDFDGSGDEEIFWYAPTGGSWIWWSSTDRGADQFRGAVGGYSPTVGDYNGDNRKDIFWYAPFGGTSWAWYGGAGTTFTELPFQAPVTGATPYSYDVAVDGTNSDDIVFWKPTDATQYVWQGSTLNNFGEHTVATAALAAAGLV